MYLKSEYFLSNYKTSIHVSSPPHNKSSVAVYVSKSGMHPLSWCFLATLECGINMPARLLIFKLFSQQHALILHSVFIHSNIFDQKYQKFMFFRLQYAHFWALILVSIKFSMRHVYHFHKFFKQECLFRQAHLFCTLEYAGWSNFRIASLFLHAR